MYTKIIELTCIPPLLGAGKRVFSQCPVIALSSKMCHPSHYSPSLLGACCLEVSGGSLWRSHGERVKPMSWGCTMHVGLLKSLGKRLLFLLDNMALVLGPSKGRGSKPNLNHSCREICVNSPRLPSPSADGLRQKIIPLISNLTPSVTTRSCTPIVTNVGRLQRGQTRICLPSSQPSKETQTRKRSASRSCAGVTNQNRGRMEAGSQATRRKSACTSSSTPFSGESGLSASPLRRVVLLRAEPGHRSYGPTIHGHAQRVPGLCQNVAERPEVAGKVGRDGGGDAGTHVLSGYGHGAGDYLMAAMKFVGWIQNFSDLSRAA